MPWHIYADDPQWVPPLLLDQKEFLDRRKHPFYLHGEAAQFLALRGGVPLGRILVSDDRRYNQEHQTNVGCFGMFESADDPEMAHALLDAAAGWLAARGRTAIMGPIDYSLNYPCGLLVEGFHTPPRIMGEPQPPLLRRPAGIVGAGQGQGLLLAGGSSIRTTCSSEWRKRAERLQRRGKIVDPALPQQGLRRRSRTLQDGLQPLHAATTGASSASATPSSATWPSACRNWPTPEAGAAGRGGRPAGRLLHHPARHQRGHPPAERPADELRPARSTLSASSGGKRRIKTARMVVLDVLEEYRRRGIAEMLILRTLDYGKNMIGYTGAELGWTLEDNDLVNRTIEAVGGRRYKVYRIYAKDLEAGGRG